MVRLTEAQIHAALFALSGVLPPSTGEEESRQILGTSLRPALAAQAELRRVLRAAAQRKR